MKYSILIFFSLFIFGCGLIPEDERYHSNESINSDDNASVNNREVLAIFRK